MTNGGATCDQPEFLLQDWRRALAGDQSSQNLWHDLDHGHWSWEPDGLHLKRGHTDWYSLVWTRCDASVLRPNLMIEVTVQGSAKGAGISFGPYRDFLTEAGSQPRGLQLEVDADAGNYRFRADGALVPPVEWNSAVTCVGDILSGAFAMKACQPEDLIFRDFALHSFCASCKISVIMTCNRFLQRLRVVLRNWCHQDAPAGAYEVLVVNPGNPDGTREHMQAVARSYPDVRICEISAPAEMATNKGAMINHALRFARGQWIWLTDADCVFPASAVSVALEHIRNRGNRLFYGCRYYLTDVITMKLLAGRVDGVSGFEAIAAARSDRPPENAPWGYTQIVSRSVFDRVRYTESFNHFAHSDAQFIEHCARQGVPPEQVPGLFCLHLDHRFAWYGNPGFL
jgi:hypothetical protein